MSVSPTALLSGTSAAIPPRALYSPREAEVILGLSHSTLYRLIAAGRLDARKIAGATRITAASIEALIAELPRAKVRAV